MNFRAVWPVLDARVPVPQLLAEARDELAALATRAGCQITGTPRFRLAPSDRVPGSGRISETVLLADAPAEPVAPRAYRKATA